MNLTSKIGKKRRNNKEPKGFAYKYTFTALRGIQANKEYYIAMCPLKLVPKIFLFDEEEVQPQLRAQRILNKARVPEIARYMLDNPKEYVFSSIAAAIDGDVLFEPISSEIDGYNIGKLSVPMTARFLICDGQHRRAGIEEALKENPDLGDETISVVFFVDLGLKRSQQMFADLNRHAVRPTKSLGILYEHRDPLSLMVRNLILVVPVFKGFTELERTTISNRSTKLFTLSSIYQGTRALLRKKKNADVTPLDQEVAVSFWTELIKHIPEWQMAIQKKVSPADLRRDYLNVHGIALHAFGIAGADLLADYPKDWTKKIQNVREIDWSRSNAELWEGRALIGGRVSKAQNNVVLTANVIKRALNLPLKPDELKIEKLFRRSSE
jgi:DNA sulfur modification protein DndB